MKHPMKRFAAAACCFLIFCVTITIKGSIQVSAQSSGEDSGDQEATYERLMEAANQMTGSLALNLQGKDGAAALADSKKLAELFDQIYVFFEKRDAADAMDFARNVKTGFGEAGELASEGKMTEAMTKFQQTRANCDGCHKAHRERTPDGDWKIK